jgi:hypothetical protein
MRLTLRRNVVNDRATIGDLIDGGFAVVTLENPWRGNGPDSSIPAGYYRCIRVQSPKFGNTFEIANVPRRTHILFHAGNTEADTLGCVLLGLRDNRRDMIFESRIAFNKFLAHTDGVEEFDLEILDP